MEKARRPPAKSRGPRPASPRADRCALVVDDEEDFAQMVAMWFRSEGWTVEVTDGVQALTLLSNRRVDLLITDLQMAGMNGWELLRQLRGRWSDALTVSQPAARIVVLSGRTENEVSHFVRRLGADAFLPKPVDRRTLINTVAALFSQPAPHGSPAIRSGR